MRYTAADMMEMRFLRIYGILKTVFGVAPAELVAFLNEQDDERQAWIESAAEDDVLDWMAETMREQGWQHKARRLFSQASGAMDAGHDVEAAHYFGALAEEHGADPDPGVRRIVAAALVRRAMVLVAGSHRYDEAVEICETVDARYGGPDGGDPVEEVARALLTKASALSGLEQHQAAAEAIERIRAMYGESQDPGIQEIVDEASRFGGELPTA